MENQWDIEEREEKASKRPPIIETSISKSKDGKWLIHKTIVTDIKPVAYFEQILKGKKFDASRVA